MKTTRLHCALVSTILATPAFAQMIPSADATTARLGGEAPLGVNETPRFESSRIPGTYAGQQVSSASCDIPEDRSLLASHDLATLGGRNVSPPDRLIEGVFASPSPFRRILVSSLAQGAIPSPGLEKSLSAASAAYREGSPETGDCNDLHLSVIRKIELDRSKVLEIVAAEVQANGKCACEIVKAAIKATDADVDTTVAIVEAAVTANPECMRIASQCAIAANPEAVSAIQSLLARLDPNSGDGYSAKSSKSAKSGKDVVEPARQVPDPLDRVHFPIIPPIPPSYPVTEADSPLR